MQEKRKEAQPIGDLVMSALKDLGMPSRRLAQRVEAAWERAADPAWSEQAVPLRLVGGVLVVGVTSASLRQELTQFHRDRLLSVLQAALPERSIVDLRFTAETRPSPPSGDDGSGDG